MNRLEEIKARLEAAKMKIRNCECCIDIQCAACIAEEEIAWLLARCERLEKLYANFANADRVELAIWEKGQLSVMNFDPKNVLAEDSGEK